MNRTAVYVVYFEAVGGTPNRRNAHCPIRIPLRGENAEYVVCTGIEMVVIMIEETMTLHEGAREKRELM